MAVIRSHDALFRFVFGQPEHAASLLRAVVPPVVAAAIDWAALRRVDASFVDAELTGRQADLLFVASVDQNPLLLYVLLEHKSHDDPFTGLQLAGYVVRIHDRWLAEHADAEHLPPVLPLVVHHGDRPWTGPRSLLELIDLDGFGPDVRPLVRELQPALRFELLDLAVMDEAAIDDLRASAVCTLTLRFLQLLRHREPEDAIADILRWRQLADVLLRRRNGRDVLLALFSWWFARSPRNPEVLRTAMSKIPESDSPFPSMLDDLLEIGELKAMRRVLKRQMETRFGAVPPDAVARLENADGAALERWSLRVLDAATLAAVFESA